MKTKNHKINRWLSTALLGVFALSMLMNSCKKDETSAGPITINKVYLEDVNSSVPDREVSFVRLGQLIRIEGTGFTGLRKVFINGYKTYFNPTLASDVSVILRVSDDTPILDADPQMRNKINFVNDRYETYFDFEVRDAAPSITSISHTLPLVGEEITVYGTGLTEVSKVTFPGSVVVVDGITSDTDGEFFTVTMPDGVAEEGGSILVECANGGAYSPAYFNCKKGVILDFDGTGVHGFWGTGASMIIDTDLESTVIGTGNTSQGIYAPHRPARITEFAPGTNRCSETWTGGNDADDWRGQLTPIIPATTPVSDFAFQFDIYVPNGWTGTGYLKICLKNWFNGGEWANTVYNYVPWIQDGEVINYQTDSWETVTIPFNEFYAFTDASKEFTFEDILLDREAATYKNFGLWIENSKIKLSNVTGNDSDSETVFDPSAFTFDVYTDNWRIVSLETPSFSDYPDEVE